MNTNRNKKFLNMMNIVYIIYIIYTLSECILSCFQGIVPAGKSVDITVSYMPGIPEEFARSFEVSKSLLGR